MTGPCSPSSPKLPELERSFKLVCMCQTLPTYLILVQTEHRAQVLNFSGMGDVGTDLGFPRYHGTLFLMAVKMLPIRRVPWSQMAVEDVTVVPLDSKIS